MFLLIDGLIYLELNSIIMVRWKFWKKKIPTECNDLECLILLDKNALMEHQLLVEIAEKELLQKELEYFRHIDIDRQSYS